MARRGRIRHALVRFTAVGVAAVVGFTLAEVTMAPAAPVAAAAPAPDPRSVPPLPSEPGAAVQPEVPEGDFTAGEDRPTEEPLAGSSIGTEEPLAGSSIGTEEPLAGSSIGTEFVNVVADPDEPVQRPARTGFVEGQSVLAERTPTANVFRNPDGTFTAKSYADVVNVRDPATGAMVPVDNELEIRGDAVRPRAGAAVVELPRRTGPGAGVRVEASDGSGGARLELEGLAERAAELDAARATYNRVQPDVDLELRVTTGGVKQTYLLRAPVADPTWSVRLHVDGELAPEQTATGAIVLKNRSGDPVLVVPAPVMFDSNVDRDSGEPQFGPVSQRLERAGSGWRVVLVADAAWIADPARVFPISVDPGSFRLTSSDAFVTDGATNTNYNVWWDSVHGFYANKVGYYPDGAGNNRAYLWFDAAPWRNKQILYSELRTAWGWAYQHTVATPYWVHTVDCGWSASTVTWNSQPCIGGWARQGSALEGYWSAVETTSIIADYAAWVYPWNGFMVEAAWNDVNGWKKMVASEAGGEAYGSPVLVVDYNDAPSVPTNLGCNACSVHTSNVTFGASSVDPNGNEQKWMQFFVSTDPNVMGTYFTSNEVVIPAGQSNATWQVNGLDWNRTYYWQARVRDGWSNWVYSQVWNFSTANVTPATPTLTGPADLAVVTTKQPTLTVDAVTDPDGDQVQYEFSIGTGADGRSGLVATSGWIAGTSWTVPTGMLKDGLGYTWTARARDVMPDTRSPYAAARKLKIDLRLGAQGPVPGDAMGPITVNLATGNVLTGASTPAMNTVGGPVSVSLTYNSQAVQEAGLTGSYFTGDSLTGILDTESPVLVRTDSAVSFQWGTASPYPPVIANDGFRVRWQGYLTVPTTGSYVFGGVHDNGMRVWIGADQVYGQWDLVMSPTSAPSFTGSIARQLTAGQPYPIRVEYRERVIDAHIRLWTKRDVDAAIPVPSSWLSPDASALPPGWSLSADVDGAGGGYVKAALSESGVTLTDSTGAAHGYTRTSDGGYAPPPGEYGVLSRDAEGRLTLIDGDGTTYEFTAAGDLASITAPADARRPAAARMEWTPLSAVSPIPRLTRIVDPVSNRAITLHYGGDPECGATGGWWDQTPSHRLCAVKLPDASKTYIYYLAGGKLARVENPGYEITDYAYYANHYLWAMRTPHALDWASRDLPARDTGALFYQLGYWPDWRPSLLLGPEPSGFDQVPTKRQRHDYSFGPDWTEVDVAGLDPAVGYARRITRDAGGRMLTDTDATGRTTTYEWDAADKQLSVTDPAGRRSTTIYDVRENPTDSYGPAPANCFGADRRPLPSPPAGCEKVPHSATRYDEGITGLAATWWANATMSGASNAYSTSALDVAWDSASPAPGVVGAANAYSGRLSGRLQIDTAGAYTFGTAENDAADGVRAYVDDNLVLNRTYPPSVLDSGPVGYWRLDDATGSTTAVDSSGAGRNGTYSGTTTRGLAGAMPDDSDTAADFAGGRVTIADADALDITGPLTIEAWVSPRHNVAGGGWHDLVSKYAGTNTAPLPYELTINPDFKLDFRQGNGTAAVQQVTSTNALVPNAWNHVAVTRDASNKITFYVNGAKSGEATIGAAAAANSTALAIGRRPAGGNGLATLDEVAIYDKVLAEKDISRHIAGAGTVNQGKQAVTLSAGTHRIRVETIHRSLTGDQTRTASGVNLTYRLGAGAWSSVPAANLTPDYGLATSSTEYESDGVPDQTTQTRYSDDGWDPAYGIATAAVANPGGLGLTTRTAFEPAGTGFLRRTSKTMPSGAQTSYAYYGDTETRDNPCTSAVDPVIQSGLERSAVLPAPASGSARVDEQVYDVLGRVVAEQVSGTGWICTTYDARGRVTSRSYPENAAAPARTVTYDYAFWTDPLVTAVGDAAGTVYTWVDLLGRTVAYQDVHGTRTEPTYDLAGRVVSEKVIPPNAADPAQVTKLTYDDAGRLLTQQSGTTTLATSTYDAAGELASVAYSNGTSLASVGRSSAGEVVSLVWTTVGGPSIVSAVVRTRSGRIVDESLGGVDARPAGPNYVYDAVGRLTRAWVVGHEYSYDLASAASVSCPAGARGNAALNTNRAGLVDVSAAGTAVTDYCYDSADRLVAALGAGAVSGVVYDAVGNTVQYSTAGSTTYLGWDSAGRNLTARAAGADPAELAYTRDATDRIVKRHAVAGDSPVDVLYSYTGGGDTADLMLAADKRILTRTIALPGGVLYTMAGDGTAQPPTWDHPSVRGDLCLRTNAAGAQVGSLRTYTPFGDPLDGVGVPDPDGDPDTTPGAMDHGWLGQHQRPHEHAGSLNLIQMGARPYSPLTGRFLSVDPIEGGSANDYDYTGADPINNTDLDGQWSIRSAWNGVKSAAKTVGQTAWKYKWDIALTALGFVPGLGAAVWAYRAYRVVRLARAATGMSGGIRATRATSWLAGRLWVGVGSRRTAVGRISADGLRQWRAPTYKPKLGRTQSNFESRNAPKGQWPNNFHVNHRKWI